MGRRLIDSIQGVAMALFLPACGESLYEMPPREPLEPVKAEVPLTLPVRWELTDVEGRVLKVSIIGRSATSITIVRESDGKRFELPVERLSANDRKRVTRLVVQIAPAKAPMESSFYRMRQASIDEVDARMDEIRSEMSSTGSHLQFRSRQSELHRLQRKRIELTEELKEFERY